VFSVLCNSYHERAAIALLLLLLLLLVPTRSGELAQVQRTLCAGRWYVLTHASERLKGQPGKDRPTDGPMPETHCPIHAFRSLYTAAGATLNCV